MTSPHAARNAMTFSFDNTSTDEQHRRRCGDLDAKSRHPNLASHPTAIPRAIDAAPKTALDHPTLSYSPPSMASTTRPVSFRTSTIAPSPPPQFDLPEPSHGSNIVFDGTHGDRQNSAVKPLRISTDFSNSPYTPPRRESVTSGSLSTAWLGLTHQTSSSSLKPITRTPSLKQALANSIGSASGTSSVIPSPIISAMGEVTPLPSPLLSGHSPGPWKMLGAGSNSPSQRAQRSRGGSVLVTTAGESIDAAIVNGPKRKMYSSIDESKPLPQMSATQEPRQHNRNRSVSEYVPDAVGIPKRTTVSGTHMKIDTDAGDRTEPHMRRELHLAESRGLTPTVTQPPTPPPSESSRDSTDRSSRTKNESHEFFEAYGRIDGKKRRWRSIRMLGQGTFSRVMLATSNTHFDEEVQGSSNLNAAELRLDRKSLVAVKVCEHGPKGGASEDRVEMSLKRELEIMQSIHHPSLVDLKAWSIEPSRAILVLSYCPGGDLFDVATTHRSVLKPALLRRIFGEVVGAVSYLHERKIVHRDIKLENVLVNLLPSELADSSIDWATYPYSVTTLTDLGLSRRTADDEKLETRCGSDDYAAPEVIMGQPYDGRATDAWSLGVLLYALLEARLPFDPHPGMSEAHRMRSRTSHRIARVEWRWVEYAGDDTDNDGDEAKFEAKGLLGAMQICEGLLKRARSRWSVEKVAKQPWVQEAIQVEGGLRFREEKEGEVV